MIHPKIILLKVTTVNSGWIHWHTEKETNYPTEWDDNPTLIEEKINKIKLKQKNPPNFKYPIFWTIRRTRPYDAPRF